MGNNVLTNIGEAAERSLEDILAKREVHRRPEADVRRYTYAEPKRLEKEEVAENWRDLFERRYDSLRKALRFIEQPTGKTFENYEVTCPEQKRAVAICRRFADRLLERVVTAQNSAAGILLVGVCGTGKTHMAYAILDELRKRKMPGFAISATDFFDCMQPSFASTIDTPASKLRELLAGVSCLVIDEVGMQSWTEAERKRLIQIINLRTANALPTVITTNCTEDEITKSGGERLASRFAETMYPIVCVWEDHRKKNALAKRNPEEIF